MWGRNEEQCGLASVSILCISVPSCLIKGHRYMKFLLSLTSYKPKSH